MILISWGVKIFIFYLLCKLFSWRIERKIVQWDRTIKGDKMKLRLDEIARELREKGLTSEDDLVEAVVEILANKDLFYLLEDELLVLENEDRTNNMTELDYLEKIGEV